MGLIDRIFKQRHKTEEKSKNSFSCGTHLNNEKSCCPQCGSSESRTCAECGSGVKKEYLYCPECGTMLPCPDCGNIPDRGNCQTCRSIMRRQHGELGCNVWVSPPHVEPPRRWHRVCPKCKGLWYSLSVDTPYCHQCGAKSVIRFCR